jgi:hypothetical protein
MEEPSSVSRKIRAASLSNVRGTARYPLERPITVAKRAPATEMIHSLAIERPRSSREYNRFSVSMSLISMLRDTSIAKTISRPRRYSKAVYPVPHRGPISAIMENIRNKQKKINERRFLALSSFVI